MDAFIENVFLAPKKMAPKPAPKVMAPRDSDGDGVTDDKDQCPTTPPGELVDEKGCTLKLTLYINFDHDKYEIKPEFKPQLDKAAAYIKRYSNVPYILLAGHTDRDGTVEYNQQLSERRANAVRDYLINNYGIKGERLFAKGFGKLQPIADNSTKEGRYQNRRVEVICCAVKPM
jgi:OOP family OmpA-OmpF porin